jgi:hypothetical protein
MNASYFILQKLRDLEVLSLRTSKIAQIVFIAALLLGSALAGEFSSKLAMDTYVDKANPEKSFGEEGTLWATSFDGAPEKITYLGFRNNFGTVGVTNPQEVHQASLKLQVTEVETPGTITAYFLHGATLDTITWMDQLEYDENTSSQIDVKEEGELVLDATDIVKKAVETCAEGCDFSIVLVAEDNASIGFASQETGQEAELKYTNT